jgi:hypothetical protein
VRRALALAAVLAIASTACGERLAEPSDAPLPDAARLVAAKDLAFATAAGQGPGFLSPTPFAHAGALHFVVSALPGTETSWIGKMSGAIRVRADGVVYRARAVPLEGAEQIDPVLPDLLTGVQRMHVGAPHWVGGSSERYPGTQLHQRFFRVEAEPSR